MKCERKTLAEVYILSIYTHADAHTLKPHIDTYKSAETPSVRACVCALQKNMNIADMCTR